MANVSDHEPQHLVLNTVPTNTPDLFSYKTATFDEVLEELSSRFILNLPEDELAEVERVCFQVEQAHWYYEDFIREEKPSFPSLPLKKFSEILFRSCPLLHHWSHDHESAFNDFMDYKTRVPVCGAIMLNEALTKCVLVKGWKASAGWSFPKGKVNEKEDEAFCAAREVLEETGFSLHGQIQREHCVRLWVRHQPVTLFVVPNVPEDFLFKPQTRKEISKIDWFKLADLPGWKKDASNSTHKFYLVAPVISHLKPIVRTLRKARKEDRLRSQCSDTSCQTSVLPANDMETSEESPETGHASQPPLVEAEASSSQSSSVEPHTPWIHCDLDPVNDHFKDDLSADESATEIGRDSHVKSPVGIDVRSHWSRLMTRLSESEDSSTSTTHASTPTPAVVVENAPTDLSDEADNASYASCSTLQESHEALQQAAAGTGPQVQSEDLARRTRQLRLLDSVLAEETTKQSKPYSAHLQRSLFGYLESPLQTYPQHPPPILRPSSALYQTRPHSFYRHHHEQPRAHSFYHRHDVPPDQSSSATHPPTFMPSSSSHDGHGRGCYRSQMMPGALGSYNDPRVDASHRSEMLAILSGGGGVTIPSHLQNVGASSSRSLLPASTVVVDTANNVRANNEHLLSILNGPRQKSQGSLFVRH